MSNTYFLRKVTYLGNYENEKHVVQAMERLIGVVHRTPLKQSATLNRLMGMNVYLKMENTQKTGSFKLRGALNKILQLSEFEASKGIVAASAGNHAQGVAFAASSRGIKSKIYMPSHTPEAKVHATMNYGAECVLEGETYQESFEAAMKEKQEKGAIFVHAFDDLDVISGQGTIALEMMQQEQDLDAIIVPVGGGGLLSGIALAVKSFNPKIKLIGVQASGAAATFNRFTGKSSKPLLHVHSIADGILVKEPGKITYPIISKYVDEMVTVSDEEIAFAMMFMLEREKRLVEGAGAAALAALMSRNLKLEKKRVGVVISGGNVDPQKLSFYKELAKKIEEERKIG